MRTVVRCLTTPCDGALQVGKTYVASIWDEDDGSLSVEINDQKFDAPHFEWLTEDGRLLAAIQAARSRITFSTARQGRDGATGGECEPGAVHVRFNGSPDDYSPEAERCKPFPPQMTRGQRYSVSVWRASPLKPAAVALDNSNGTPVDGMFPLRAFTFEYPEQLELLQSFWKVVAEYAVDREARQKTSRELTEAWIEDLAAEAEAEADAKLAAERRAARWDNFWIRVGSFFLALLDPTAIQAGLAKHSEKIAASRKHGDEALTRRRDREKKHALFIKKLNRRRDIVRLEGDLSKLKKRR